MPGVEAASERAQLLCARTYLAADLAARTEHAWTALSRATHNHGYELAPTAAELAGWLATVKDLDHEVRRRIELSGRSHQRTP
jgi:hypothetical protein